MSIRVVPAILAAAVSFGLTPANAEAQSALGLVLAEFGRQRSFVPRHF